MSFYWNPLSREWMKGFVWKICKKKCKNKYIFGLYDVNPHKIWPKL